MSEHSASSMAVVVGILFAEMCVQPKCLTGHQIPRSFKELVICAVIGPVVLPPFGEI